MPPSALATPTTAPSLNPALRTFWETPARYRVLYGGRASSKSWDAAGFVLFLAQAYRIRVMCARQFQNKIEESVYTLLKSRIAEFGMQDEFQVLSNKIVHKGTGSEFIFYGMARNFEEIKSTEGIDICWLEEAQYLTAEQWRELDPTFRKAGAQVWLIFNPKYATDFVWKRFVVNPLPNSIVRKINYTENPFLDADYVRTVIHAMRDEDEEEYQHVYLGEPLPDDERVIIKRAWLVAATDAHKKLGIIPSGARRIGYDVADDGSDQNAMVTAYGQLMLNTRTWKGLPDDLLGSCTQAYNLARSLQAKIYYDNIGVGAGAGSKFKELNLETGARVIYEGFGAGDKVLNPDDDYKGTRVRNRDYFSNLKAQAWWSVADRLRATYNAVERGHTIAEADIISINSGADNLAALTDELSTPRRDFDKAGRVKVESKADLAKRGVPSPNLADAFIMAYNPLVAASYNYGDLL